MCCSRCVALRFAGEPWAIPAYPYLAAIGVALAAIDLDVHRLPDAIVLPSYPVLAALLAWRAGASVTGRRSVRAGIGAVALGAFYLVPGLLGGMGMGDVKLAALLGAALAWLGWGALAVGVVRGVPGRWAWAVVLLLWRRAGRRSRVPFGPWMILGAAIGVAVGEQLWSLYLGTFS